MICPTCRHIHHEDVETCWVCGTVLLVVHEPPPSPPPQRPTSAGVFDDGYPRWLLGAKYIADADVIELLVDPLAGSTLLSSPEQIEQLVELFTKCLDRSRQQRSMIDVPSVEKKTSPRGRSRRS